MSKTVFETLCARAPEGMEIAAVAASVPDRPAIVSQYGDMTFGELNAQVNQLAYCLREAGVKAGDAIALACGNRPEFIVVRFAAHRLGLRLTPVNWHLSPQEIAYVVDDCDAVALFMDTRITEAASIAKQACPGVRLAVAIGGEIEGYQSWDACLAAHGSSDIEDPALGSTMLYTSGTTGRPKGVVRDQPDAQKAADMQAILTAVFQFEPESGDDLALVTGPLYHSGPFNLCMTTPLTAGIGCVLMDKWTPEETLALIERHKISHTFFVPTMMKRLLDLDPAIRTNADISSVRFVIHGAAPCPVEIKKSMLDWFGPVIWEIFAGTEGPGTMVSPQEWLAKPGTVGKPGEGQVRILDDQFTEVPAGESGTLYLVNPPGSAFRYHKDEEKTARSLRDGYFTAGDVGYIDEDGYLFLTGRSAEIIISGGVNIYPQEIDDTLVLHPAVSDVACVGVPDPDLGEVVKAVVKLKDSQLASDTLAAELIAYCDGKIARQKWPRSVDFCDDLPRSEAGKVLRKALRARYCEDAAAEL